MAQIWYMGYLEHTDSEYQHEFYITSQYRSDNDHFTAFLQQNLEHSLTMSLLWQHCNP